MTFKNGLTEKEYIVRCGVDRFLPIALVFGLYIIIFGTVSPGGGFQGGVIVSSSVLLLYIGYGYRVTTRVLNPEVLRINEAVGATLYALLGFIGLFFGANYCRNIFFDNGEVGEIISGGNITFMGYAVGYKVLCGIGFLLILMLGLLAPDSDEEEEAEPSESVKEGTL